MNAINDGTLENSHRKYREEREKRLRTDGMKQFVKLGAAATTDPHKTVEDRSAVTEDVTVAFVGGGYAGVLTCARLAQVGINDVKIIDAAGGFGGSWYWNQYPGLQCDTASMVYLPMLEETGYIPTEKWARGPEILEHAQRIAKEFELDDKALFHTKVTALSWDDTTARWVLTTDRGDRITARFVGLGLGVFNVPKVPDLPGANSFSGKWFHTSRWDYDYTGGDSAGAPMAELRDKRVAVIGTGSSSVQIIPPLARDARELLVFQRTPSAIAPRDNGPIDPAWFQDIAKSGWQQEWQENWALNWDGLRGLPPAGVEYDDIVQDGWTRIGRRTRDTLVSIPPDSTLEEMMSALDSADLELMEEIRSRVDTIVSDPATAERLKPWYKYWCKRPCFNDEYLPTFNRSNVKLVDTDGKGVERITERGVVAAGVEHEVDCIIYATGFQVFDQPFLRKAGFTLTGRDGIDFDTQWTEGIRTMHGIHSHGLPNLFHVQYAQGAPVGANLTLVLDQAALTVAATIKEVLDRGHRAVEATFEGQTAWVDLLSNENDQFSDQDCTPGYYNSEGEGLGVEGLLARGYPGGASEFFSLQHEWRTSGEFEGMRFS